MKPHVGSEVKYELFHINFTNSRHQKHYSLDGKNIRECCGLLGRVIPSPTDCPTPQKCLFMFHILVYFSKFNFTYISHNYDNYSMTRDVPEFFGLFHVPCSMFHVPCSMFHVACFCFNRRLVQSLNSTFFPPQIGAKPGRAKEESR